MLVNFSTILKGGAGSGRHKLSDDANAIIDKVQAGTHRMVKAKGGSKYTLERKRPSTGEWLIGVKVHAATGKSVEPFLRKEDGVHSETWYANNA